MFRSTYIRPGRPKRCRMTIIVALIQPSLYNCITGLVQLYCTVLYSASIVIRLFYSRSWNDMNDIKYESHAQTYISITCKSIKAVELIFCFIGPKNVKI
jgi:hypothetical protein